MPVIDKKKRMKNNQCAICGRRTFRSQHGIFICSFCELTYRVEFEGSGRKLIDRNSNQVVQDLH